MLDVLVCLIIAVAITCFFDLMVLGFSRKSVLIKIRTFLVEKEGSYCTACGHPLLIRRGKAVRYTEEDGQPILVDVVYCPYSCDSTESSRYVLVDGKRKPYEDDTYTRMPLMPQRAPPPPRQNPAEPYDSKTEDAVLTALKAVPEEVREGFSRERGVNHK
jgi:hypothetical protein